YAPISGPLNILLVGVDTRESQPAWQPHADAVLILHVPASLDRAYVTSLPRDLLVTIPAFPPARFGGERTKLTHAMSYGSRVPGGGRPNVAQGFQLLARTVSGYTGIRRFDAGAVLTFRGFDALVDAVGGVQLTVDQRVVSMHRRPDGRHRTLVGGGYVGPQMVYPPGRRTFNGWQALDYARQRYLSGGDYARQRHHQQLVKALIGKIASLDTVRDPRRLDRVLRALGKTLTFDGRGRRVVDFAYALRRLRPAGVTLVGLPGGGVGSGGGYLGEQLQPVAGRYFAALRGNRLPAFVAANRSLLVKG
ncbi:MAG TPA: LCP family protein, partial [Pilimelia sp.]|nr:LCP family protein [Pilimelia sp.]